jgi:hypothetical protein
MTNPNSFREYFIPQSGVNGGPGYADLVNKNAYEVFEIKPDNPDGRKSGIEEAKRYVDNANVHCSPSLEGSSKKWTQGILYTSRTLLYPLDITKQLNVFRGEPGVIVYNIAQKNTIPQQILIPKEVLDKIKSLLKDLKKDMDNLEEKILVYLQEYPEVIKYIKAAAVGAAVTIVIGTIIEDIITLGAGVADDWASFLMAYKLVRIACLL